MIPQKFSAIVNKPLNPRFSGPSAKLAVAATTLLLAGCASSAELATLREAPGYSAGYGDGCSTATEEDKSFSTASTRDAYEFDNDPAYRAGWRQGYLECGNTTPDAKDGGRILGERNEY